MVWALGSSARQNQLFFYYAGGGAASVGGTDDIPLRKWTHCAVVRDNNTLRTYVNGVQTVTEAVSASDPMKTTTHSVTIAADSNGGYDLRIRYQTLVLLMALVYIQMEQHLLHNCKSSYKRN